MEIKAAKKRFGLPEDRGCLLDAETRTQLALSCVSTDSESGNTTYGTTITPFSFYGYLSANDRPRCHGPASLHGDGRVQHLQLIIGHQSGRRHERNADRRR